jgi:hypothetical protein
MSRRTELDRPVLLAAHRVDRPDFDAQVAGSGVRRTASRSALQDDVTDSAALGASLATARPTDAGCPRSAVPASRAGQLLAKPSSLGL